jgi:N,N'-diacetyllegionaminate synthase
MNRGRTLEFQEGRCLVIGEVAQAHDGSLGLAHAFIDAIADAGADAVKFQTHIAAAESTRAEPWRKKFGWQDASRYEYWQRMEFTPAQWAGLQEHAVARDLLFLSSPFSLEAVELLEQVGVAAWKVASGELGNTELLERMIQSDLPMLLSTGMSGTEEIDRAVAMVLDGGLPLAVLQCTSAYPVEPHMVGLNVIPQLRDRYGCRVGLSDHSGTIYPGLAAATIGIDVLEVHVTLSREMFGPDVGASLTTSELRQLVEGVRYIERMMRQPVDKDVVAAELAPMRAVFTKSIVAREPLGAGTVLQREHLALKKPGSGLPPERLPALIGRQLKRAVAKDELLTEDALSHNGE